MRMLMDSKLLHQRFLKISQHGKNDEAWIRHVHKVLTKEIVFVKKQQRPTLASYSMTDV